jgi:hypothetical protein
MLRLATNRPHINKIIFIKISILGTKLPPRGKGERSSPLLINATIA